MKARLMRQVKEKKNNSGQCIFFAHGFTMPHKPRFHALGSIILGVSAIYEYGVSYLLSPSLALLDLDYSCRRGAKEATSHPLPLPLPLSLIVLPIFSTEVKH